MAVAAVERVALCECGIANNPSTLRVAVAVPGDSPWLREALCTLARSLRRAGSLTCIPTARDA